MSPVLQQTLEVAKLSLALGLVPRATFHEDGTVPESDTTHTTMLGILGVALANRFPEMKLDPGLVAQFALIHDLPEAICGDTNSLGITAEAQRAKADREAEAHVEILGRLSGFHSIVRLLEDYHEQRSPEARFVRVLDKVLPKLTHALNQGAALPRLDVSPDDLRQKHDAQIEALRAEYPDMPPPLLGLLKEACEHAYASYRDGGCWERVQAVESVAGDGTMVSFGHGFVIERNGSFYAGGGRGVSSMQEAKVYTSEADARGDQEAMEPLHAPVQILPFHPGTQAIQVPWTFAPAYRVDTESCDGREYSYWRAEAERKKPGHTFSDIIMGVGATPAEAEASVRANVASYVEKSAR